MAFSLTKHQRKTIEIERQRVKRKGEKERRKNKTKLKYFVKLSDEKWEIKKKKIEKKKTNDDYITKSYRLHKTLQKISQKKISNTKIILCLNKN